MLRRVQSWLDLADERLADADLRCFVCPGNDDQFEVDEVIMAQAIEACEAAWSRSTGSSWRPRLVQPDAVGSPP